MACQQWGEGRCVGLHYINFSTIQPLYRWLLIVVVRAAGSCDIKKGLDIKGGEVINDGKREITNSDGECCRKCNDRSGGFTHSQLHSRYFLLFILF